MRANCITKTASDKKYIIFLSNVKIMTTLILLLFSIISFSQNIGDYQSKATGNWNSATTWETWNGSAWVESGTPTSADGVISIRVGHTVTITAAVTIDQVVIEEGGKVIHSASATVTLNNGSGTDLQIFGTWRRTTTFYTISISSGATMSVESGGIYEHAIGGSGGSIPTASWNANSILRIMNSAAMSSAPTNLSQTFGIVEINIPDQTNNWAIDDFTDVTNEFRVISTGSGYIRLNTSKTFSGSFDQSGGRFINALASSSTTFTIGGNLTVSGGSFEVSNNLSTPYADAVVVNGNIIVNGGTIDLNNAGATNANAGRIFVKGNLTVSSGEIARTQTRTDGSTGIYFDGTGDQTFTWSGGTINSQVLKRFYYKTSSGPTGLNEVYSASVAQSTVNGSEGSPTSGYSTWPTSGSLIKNLTINNPAGVTLSTDKVVNTALYRTSGALSGTPNLTYASGATLHYNGTAAITTADKEFPSSNGPTNFVVSNPGGVTLHANRTLSGNLTINNSGLLNLGVFTLNRGSSGGTLTLGDGTTLQIGGTNGFPTNYATNTINATSTVVYNGTTQTAAGTGQGVVYGNLELSGSSAKSFASTPDVAGNFVVGESATVIPTAAFRFSGASAQSIAGLAYNNIEFSNAGAKTFTLNASLSPESAVTFSGDAGTVDFDGASNNLEFVLQSTDAGTARVGNATGWTLSGQVRAERFVPDKRAWRLLTAPLKGSVQNSIFSNWQGINNEGLLLWHPQGGGTTGLEIGPQANIWSYTGTGWTAVSNTNTTNLFDTNVNNAYLVFVTGSFGSQNISSGAEITTLKPEATLITGDVNYSLIANHFKLIGNPYASPINTETIVSDNPGSKVWILDPTTGLGAYVTYDGSVWSVPTPNGNDKFIQSGQAFFIRRNSTSFIIKETHKITGNSNTWFERNAHNVITSETSDRIRVLLYKQDTNNNWLIADGALAVNQLSGNNEVDDVDSGKISNFNESVFFRNGSSNLSIEYKALPQEGDIQPLRLIGTTTTGYQLRLYTENYTNSNIQPYLEDTQTATTYAIPTDGSEVIIPFTGIVSNSNNPITRFRIVYQTTLGTEDPKNFRVSIYPNPVKDGYLKISLDNSLSNTTYTLTNILGQEVQSGNLLQLENVIKLNTLQKGVYIINVKQQDKEFSKKIIIN